MGVDVASVAELTEPVSEVQDGRRARRERGRLAVIDATFDLLQERSADAGGPLPNVDDVAGRAGVSVASVYRYVESLAELRLLAFQRFLERFRDLLELDVDPQLDRGERVARFVTARLDLYEQAGSIMVLGRLRAVEDDQLVAAAITMRSKLADQVGRSFAPELAALAPATGADLAASIDALTSLDGWTTMRSAHARTQRQIRRSWERALNAVLSAWETR